MIQGTKLFQWALAFIAVSVFSLTACDTVSDDGSQAKKQLTIQFQANSTTSSTGLSSNGQAVQAENLLTIEGTNGSLLIEDLRFVVEDFELERSEAECEDVESEAGDNCEEFESEPFFVDLPLNGDALNLDTAPIALGLYEELEFEVDNLEMDEGESQEERQDLINLVRSEFADWPDVASMVIVGSFTNQQGEVTNFRTYAEAEVEIELAFEPPLELNESTASDLIRVNIDPSRWFTSSDGSVINLSEYDFDNTGRILELEVEIENGFESIERDDEDDQDEDDDEDDE